MSEATGPALPEESPTPRWLKALHALRHRKMLAMLLLSLAAGLPYGAVLGTLNAWLTAENITPSEIGILNFIILAYSFKLIWAPGFQKAWFPKIRIPGLAKFGPRRSWLLTMQIAIAIMLVILSRSDPSNNVAFIALISAITAVMSSIHDIVLDAWRIEIAETDEDKDLMSAIYQFGFRIAGLITGMFALILADHIPWSSVYLLIALAMAASTIGSIIAREPDHSSRQSEGQDLRPTYAAGLSTISIRGSIGLVSVGWAIAIVMIVLFVAQSLGVEPPPSAAAFTREQAPIIVFLIVILPGIVAAFLLGKSKLALPSGASTRSPIDRASHALFHTIVDPMMDLIQRLRWAALLVLLLVLSYRFVDLIWGGFAYPFYLGQNFGALGHSNTDVAIASKTIGVFMTLAGAGAGGAALIFIGRLPCLFIGAFLSAITNLLFADLAGGGSGMNFFLGVTGLDQLAGLWGGDMRLFRLIVAIAGENLAGGFASVAFVAYLTSIVNPKFAAVQYTLLGSITMLIGSLGRAELGVFIETDGFRAFFILTAWLGGIAVVLSAAEWARQKLFMKSEAAPAMEIAAAK